MKIVFYTMSMMRGGTERTIANLANHFVSDNDVVIITNINSKFEYELDNKIKCIKIDKFNKKDEFILKKVLTKLSLKRSKKLKEIINYEKPDAVIAMLPEPSIRLLSLKKYFPNTKFIISIRNHPLKEFNYPIAKLIRNYYFKKADKIIVQSNSYKKYFNKKIKSKITEISNYIPDEFLNFDSKVKKDKKIVSMTRLEKQKNLPLLIKAFSKLDTKYNDYKLYIYGEGSKKDELTKLIKDVNMSNRIFLMGNTKDVCKILSSSEIFILPSNYEGMPNALLEAMALKLPVITTNSTEVINDLIDNGKNGIIVKKNDITGLKTNIEYLLENKKYSKELGINAYNTIKKYNQEEILTLWENEIIKEKKE